MEWMYFVCKENKTLGKLDSGILWTGLCFPPGSYLEDLIPNVIVFRDEAFKEVIIKVK